MTTRMRAPGAGALVCADGAGSISSFSFMNPDVVEGIAGAGRHAARKRPRGVLPARQPAPAGSPNVRLASGPEDRFGPLITATDARSCDSRGRNGSCSSHARSLHRCGFGFDFDFGFYSAR